MNFSALASSTLLIFQWATFTWSLSDWFVRPKRVTLVLFILAILPLLLRSHKWQNLIGKPAAIALAIYLFFISPLAARLLIGGLDNRFYSWWDQAQNLEDPVDAMVILGRGWQLNPERINVAAQMEKAKPTPIIFASGYGDAPTIVDALKRQGISSEKLQGEDCSLTTEENALFTSSLLQPQGIRRILLITDSMHLLRSRLIFQSYGFQVIPRPSPIPSDLPSAQRSAFAMREYLGLISYGLMGRFYQRSPLTEIPESVLSRIETTHCRIRA